MTTSTSPFNTADVIRSAATSLADSLARAVVQVRTPDTGSGGTGLIWGATGLVVTNAHCVPRGATIELSSEGRWREARVIAYHPPHDLALLASPSLAGREPSLELRDADSLRPGELLFAHGHPLGVRDALAMGVLHDVARDRRTGAPRWIVADVRLAPGNSGGPLVDAEGRLVGINSMVVNGLGVAVPAALAQQFIERVLAKRAA